MPAPGRCRSQRGCGAGCRGWVPDDLIQALEHQFVAASDFSAVELTCKARDRELKMESF